jgi:hypothetical protein
VAASDPTSTIGNLDAVQDLEFASDLYNHFNAAEQEGNNLFHSIMAHCWCNGSTLDLQAKLLI